MEYMEDNLDDWLADELEVSTGASSVAALARALQSSSRIGLAAYQAVKDCQSGLCMEMAHSCQCCAPPTAKALLQAFGEDDYLIFDCPGQIELYSHVSVFRTLVDWMRGQGWSMCAVYCLDCQFITETPKFIAGAGLAARAANENGRLPTACLLLVCQRYLLDYRCEKAVVLLSARLGHAVLAAALLAGCAGADLGHCCRQPAGSVCYGPA